MVGKPARWPAFADNELKPFIYGDEHSIMIPCELYHPASMEGRTVYIYLDQQDITEILLVLKERAISARSKPL